MKISDLKDFIDRECHINLAIVVACSEGKSSKGSKYLSLTLQDSTGTIEAKKWEVSPSDEQILAVKKVVAVDGYPLIYNNSQLQFKIVDVEPVINYNEEELYQIFKSLAQKEKYQLSSQVKEILLEDFRNQRTSKSFSNGRYVRNIYEKVKIEQANRVSSNVKENINLIKKCDVEAVLVEQKSVEVHKVKIGFAV